MAISGLLRVAADVTQTQTDGTNTTESNTKDNLAWQVADGVAANQADLKFYDRRTLADGASEELDLSGVLTDAFGAALAFARIKALRINIISGSARLLVGGAAANAWFAIFNDATDKAVVEELFFAQSQRVDAFPVTAATADILRIEHDGSDTADIIYDILIIGASA